MHDFFFNLYLKWSSMFICLSSVASMQSWVSYESSCAMRECSCGCRSISCICQRADIWTFFIVTNQFSLFRKGQCMLHHHLTIANRPMRYCVTSDRLICLRTMGCGLFIFLCVPAMNRPPTNWPSIPLECTLCFLLFSFFLQTCSLYRGFLCWRDQKKCSLFRVGRCSL